MRKKLLLAMVFALIVSACSGGATVGPEGSTDTPTAQDVGTLKMNAGDPSTLDPAFCGDTGCAAFVSEIYSGLFRPMLRWQVNESPGVVARCPEGTDDEDICLVADISVDFGTKTVNADDTVTYVFDIRQDVYFHNGRQLTAADVKWSWERAANPSLGSSTFELYLTDIVGAWDRFRRRTDEISGVQVIDDFTLSVTIDGDKPFWLWNLAYPTTFVVDMNQADPVKGIPNWTANPNGTGPFKLDEYIPGHRLILVRNDNYYLRDVTLERAIFNLAGGSTLTKYEAGELNVAGIGLADIDRVRNPNDPLNADLVEGRNEIGTFYIGFNMDDATMQDDNLRKALAASVQRELIASVILKNAVVPAYSFTPPGMPDYAPPIEATQRYDIALAKELLAQSDYDGTPLRLTVSGQGANTSDWIQSVVETWRTELGVEVIIEQAGDFQTYQRDLKQGNLQMFVVGWIADYPDPYDFLDLKLHGDRSAANNEVRYDNPEFDALLELAQTEQDVQTRMALYLEAERILLEDVPVIVMFHGKNALLKKSNVEGFRTQPMVMPRLGFVTVHPVK